MNSNLFLDYETDSKDKVVDYFQQMDLHLKVMTDPEFPYVTGDFEKGIKKYLEDKELSFEEKNPEDVLKEMSEYFHGTTRWHHPYVMNNIKTPVNIPAAVVGFHTMLLDPNFAADTNCGQMIFSEFEVTKYISQLVGWDWNYTGGYFTFGGTSTVLNAVKVGINKVIEDSCSNGINKDLFIVSSEQGHSVHADVCNWLGIGSNRCFRMPVDKNYQMDIIETEKIICEKLEQGGKLAAIIACGGTTIQSIVDPIEEIYKMRERIVKKFKLKYMPHIHIDSVVGWIWLFYKGYDYKKNSLKISEDALIKIRQMETLISQSEYADSIGIDFHKTGFCPYSSSMFLTRKRHELHKLNGKTEKDFDVLEFGEYSPSTYTLELSRSAVGAITALTTLKILGIQGHRRLLGNIIEGSEFLANGLNSEEQYEVINRTTTGTCTLFIIKPPGNKISYSEVSSKSENEVIEFAKYNYNFYLYVLSKIKNHEIDFFIDYSSGYEKVKKGFQMGVLKMQTFNPMLSKEKVDELICKIKSLKKEYDENYENLSFDAVYKPKGFKLIYKNGKF